MSSSWSKDRLDKIEPCFYLSQRGKCSFSIIHVGEIHKEYHNSAFEKQLQR